jgi:hypothetical protein
MCLRVCVGVGVCGMEINSGKSIYHFDEFRLGQAGKVLINLILRLVRLTIVSVQKP